ncbi:MAG: L-rhamnose mutarotase [Alloprevotella sp.]|nr:L-rhamnose mutarotase [Alloprevotella sp.]
MKDLDYGYATRRFQEPTKRYCQTLDLQDEPDLIAAYRRLHSPEGVWRETLEAIRAAGILEMEIYLLGTRLFMIVEMPAALDWDEAMARMAAMPKQAEWEALTARYQQADPTAGSAEKWCLMERIFHLYE